MKEDIIQTSFAGGEFGPSLYGRTDIAQYANACALVRNMLPRPYGSAISMPGTRYVATVSDSTLATRLIKFVFNRTDAYAIEMGDLYMRFFTDRGQVITPAGTETLTDYATNLKAHWKCNDNTNSTTVLDDTTSHNGTLGTLTSSLTTTAIVSTGFNLNSMYHISVADHSDFTRTASSQPMTVIGWFYYDSNLSKQVLFSKAGEYELSINSSDALSFAVTSGDANTVFLCHADGVDGSTTFTDSSSSSHAITATGNAQVDTADQKFGTGSALLDGTGDYLSVADSADWDFGTGDFTVDAWVKFVGTGYQCVAGHGTDWSFRIRPNDGGGSVQVTIMGSLVIDVNASTFSINTWNHVALVRSSGTIYVFINGSIFASVSDSSNITGSGSAMLVGSDGTFELNGWVDEIRIVKGVAAWTSAFTPAADAYTSSASNTWQTDSSITQGWHFFGLVFKGIGTSSTDCKIYVDGVTQSISFNSNPAFTSMSDTSSLFRIGSSSSAGANNWKSKIDNIAFIHQELTAVQIASLYTSTSYQISTVFTANEVFDVHYTQLNDVIWLTHPNHPPQKLIRVSANEWTISNAPILGGPFLDNNTPILTSNSVSASSITITPSATLGTINITVSPTNASLFTMSGSTLGHQGTYWMIGGLSLTNTTTGLQENGYVRIINVVNSYTATATVIKTLKSTSAHSIWAEGAWSSVRGYPARIAIQGNRLWYARTSHEPQKEWGSKVFDYENFSLDTQADDDGLNLPLSSNESNEIQYLAGGKSLVAGTFGGVFITNSGSSEAITPNNVTASEDIGFGSEDIMPKKVSSFLYYVQRFGKKLRELFYNWDLDTYKAVDRTILSPHILGDGVVDMDVQNNPETILYCVLTTGTLATLTREVDQEFAAWASHSTAGTYSSIAIIPSQSANYDEAWVIVERYVQGNKRKYVEFFENVEVPSRQDQCLYLHSALTYDAYEASTASSATVSLSGSSGSVTLTSSTAYFNGGMIGKRVRAINSSGTTLGEGTITATASTTSITVSITTTFNSLIYSPGFWGVSVSSVSGLNHLEAKTVGILADGITESLTITVASGSLTLGSDYFVVSAGLSYDNILYTLPKESGAQRGTAQGKIQRFSEISFKVNRSTQDFKYGTDADNLDNINQSFTPTVTSLYTGVLPPQAGAISMRGGYTRGAQIYIKNSNPLPLEILSIMGQLDTNEK